MNSKILFLNKDVGTTVDTLNIHYFESFTRPITTYSWAIEYPGILKNTSSASNSKDTFNFHYIVPTQTLFWKTTHQN